MYFGERPRQLRSKNYTLELTPADQYLWQDKSDKSQRSPAALAEQIVIQFFELAD